MSDKDKDNQNLGDNIMNVVKDAMDSMDFSKLNQSITNTVSAALEEAKKGIQQGKQKAAEKKPYEPDFDSNGFAARQKTTAKEMKQPQGGSVVKVSKAPIAKSPKGKISGVMLTVGGWVGVVASTVVIGVSALIGGMAHIFMEGLMTGAVAIIPLLAVSIGAVIGGGKIRKRVNRFYDYVKQLSGKAYINIIELANAVGKSNKFVIKDVQKMIDLGMFPEGRMDDAGTALMLSDDAYEEYLKMNEGERLKKEAEERKKAEEERRKQMAALNPVFGEACAVIDEGKKSIRRIREANKQIPGEAVSKKLYRLEAILIRIFDYLEENPDKLAEIRKFIGYYLPTTEKLVAAYADLERQPVEGQNIRQAKSEIEGTLDTINKAFENLLDSFYADTALDISTDITVLETMLAQEGLTEGDFEQK